MRANAVQMDKVMAAIRAAGIAERDIQTSGINLNPQYKYVENQPPSIVGYQASNNVNVKVRDLARLGKVLDAFVANGANQINGPSFEVDKPDEAYDEARLAALKKAQARANTYAAALGLQRTPHRQHQRGRREPAATDADDAGDGNGFDGEGNVGVAGRGVVVGEHRRRVRAGALR